MVWGVFPWLPCPPSPASLSEEQMLALCPSYAAQHKKWKREPKHDFDGMYYEDEL
jgi:hypothetical protein